MKRFVFDLLNPPPPPPPKNLFNVNNKINNNNNNTTNNSCLTLFNVPQLTATMTDTSATIYTSSYSDTSCATIISTHPMFSVNKGQCMNVGGMYLMGVSYTDGAVPPAFTTIDGIAST